MAAIRWKHGSSVNHSCFIFLLFSKDNCYWVSTCKWKNCDFCGFLSCTVVWKWSIVVSHDLLSAAAASRMCICLREQGGVGHLETWYHAVSRSKNGEEDKRIKTILEVWLFNTAACARCIVLCNLSLSSDVWNAHCFQGLQV
jgi:hypothetical protein